MKVIDPTPINLLSTNIPENSEPQWDSETTYGLGDKVKVTPVYAALNTDTVLNEDTVLSYAFLGQTPHKVYESLRGANLNRFPKDHLEPQVEVTKSTTSHACETGTKTFAVESGKSFSPGMVVKIAKTVTPRTINMTAEVISYSGTSLQVSIYSKTGEGTHNNWTITSEDEIGFWKEVSSTEQYKMFDEYLNTQTLSTENITVKLDFEHLDFVSLFNLVGQDVTIEVWDRLETTLLFSKTSSLSYGSSSVKQIFDWYEYFFGAAQPLETLFTDVGDSFRDAVLVIRITAEPEVEVGCGNVVCGRVHDIGKVQHGASVGIQDYSIVETDEEGRTKLVPGYWAKRGEFTLYLDSWQTPNVYKVLSGLAGIPTAWIVDDGGPAFEYATLYGVFRDFSVIASSPTHAWCNLEIDGLI